MAARRQCLMAACLWLVVGARVVTAAAPDWDVVRQMDGFDSSAAGSPDAPSYLVVSNSTGDIYVFTHARGSGGSTDSNGHSTGDPTNMMIKVGASAFRDGPFAREWISAWMGCEASSYNARVHGTPVAGVYALAWSAGETHLIRPSVHKKQGNSERRFNVGAVDTATGVTRSKGVACFEKDFGGTNVIASLDSRISAVDVSATNRVAIAGQFGIYFDPVALGDGLLVFDYDVVGGGLTLAWTDRNVTNPLRSPNDAVHGVRWTSAEDVFAVGQTAAACPSNFQFTKGCDIMVSKYSRDGTLLARRQVARASGTDIVLANHGALALDELDDALYIAGRLKDGGIGTVDISSVFLNAAGAGTADCGFLLRVDAGPLTVAWGRYLLRTGIPHQVWAHHQHGVFIAGQTEAVLDASTHAHAGGVDIALWKLAPDGSLVHTWQLGTAADDVAYSFYWRPESGRPPHLAGSTAGNLAGTLAGNTDIWVATLHYNTSCPPTMYATLDPECSPCQPGHFSSQASVQVCQPCGPGFSCPGGTAESTICKAGSYSSRPANALCTPCQAGFFSESDGSVSCAPCVKGSYSASNASSCLSCPKDTYQDEVAQSSCKACPFNGRTQTTGIESKAGCSCDPGSYGDPGSSVAPSACRACPGGAKCPRGSKTPLPPPGFYIESADLDTMYTCSPRSSCPGDALDSCAPGYVGTGCVECDAGYTRKNLECAECTANLPPWLSITLLGAAVVGVCACVPCLPITLGSAYVVYAKVLCRSAETEARWGRRVKRWRKLLQRAIMSISWIVRLLQLSGIVLALDIPWPGSMNTFFETVVFPANVFNVENVVELDCILEGTPVTKGAIGVVIIAFVLFAVVASPCVLILPTALISLRVHRLFRTGPNFARDLQGQVSVLVRVIGRAWLLLYIPLHVAAVNAFRCYRVSDSSAEFRLVVEPGTLCYTTEGEWVYYAGVAAAVFVLVSVSFPVLVAVLMCLRGRTRVGSSPLFADRFGFLYESYNERYYYFAAVDLLQRMMIPFGFLLAMNGVFDQLIFMSFMTLLFLIFVAANRVFKNPIDQALSFLVQSTVYVMTLSAICFMVEDVPESASVALTVIIIVTFSSVVVVALLSLFDTVFPSFLGWLCRVVDSVWPPPKDGQGRRGGDGQCEDANLRCDQSDQRDAGKSLDAGTAEDTNQSSKADPDGPVIKEPNPFISETNSPDGRPESDASLKSKGSPRAPPSVPKLHARRR